MSIKIYPFDYQPKPKRNLVKKTLLREALNLLGAAFIIAGIVSVLVVGILGFLTGCGETYIDANGERHPYVCFWDDIE